MKQDCQLQSGYRKNATEEFLRTRYLFILLVLVVGFAPLPHQAQAPAPEAKAQVMILGVYHFHNPNQDYVKTAYDDHLSDKRQQQIADVLAALAKFKPTKIALEAPPDAVNIQQDYANYLKGGYKLTANEREQLGFRLAQQLGHQQVYLIDHLIGMDTNAVIAAAQQSNNKAFLTGFQKVIGEVQEIMKRQAAMTVRDNLLQWNEPSLLARSRDFYLQMARVRSADKFVGADEVTRWYQRNFRIFTNLSQLIRAPEDRVLVIFGNGHAPLLRELVQSSPDMKLVEPNAYLRP